ncbi:uncharacterized protein LOC144881587 [Branchiostoma floridae x Branchiostoma japonicum]
MSTSEFPLAVTVTLERSLDSHVRRSVDRFMERCSHVVSSTTLSSSQTWNQDALPSKGFELQPRSANENDTAETFFCFLRLEWCKLSRKVPGTFDRFGWLTPDEKTSAYSLTEKNTPVHSDVALKTFALGAFKERSTFINHYHVSKNARSLERQVTFEHDRKQLVVHFKPSEDGDLHKFEVDYDNLEDYILVDDSNVQTELYFFLKHPLKVFRATDPGKGCRVDKIDSVNAQTVWRRTTSFAGCTTRDLGDSSCLQLVVHNDGTITDISHAVLSRLCQTCGFTANYVSVQCVMPSPHMQEASLAHFECVYSLRVFLSRGYTVTDQADLFFFQKLREAEQKHGPSFVCEILRRLTLTVESNRFADIDTALHNLLAMRDTILGNEQSQYPDAHRMVRRVFVTPTRLMFMHPEIVRDNRILRKYGQDNFMRVSIRDEDFCKLAAVGRPGEEETTFTRVKQFLQDGLIVGDREYVFLAASNSQLREHNVWFFASDGTNTAESIRRDMGDFSHIRCPATVLARMGQCFSNTEPSVIARTSDREAVQIPEVEGGHDPVNSKAYCFSDGIGKISPSLALKVCREIGRRETEVPSAYQIRYGGVKGVVAVDPSLHRDVMQVRQSMIKFVSPDENIEICMTSHPARLYLNRPVIVLLSALGVSDQTFQTLQEARLQNLADMLVREDVAFKFLKRRAQPLGLPLGRLSRCGLHVTTEPFFRAMLQKMFTCFLGELRRRARIEIPPEYGRNMLGVLDETGTLDYGQVFVQYTKDIADKGGETKVLTGDVVVTRSPCFHPGDVRKLRAVDVPGLHHMVDVIVFPSKGERPHPDEMSGGDLDGDEFFVTWYPGLIFPKPNQAPMHFKAQPKKELPSVEIQDIKDFIVEYIRNDILGQIANAHRAFAHTEKEGVFSSKCLRLAEKHSDAVDFPKTGICPSLEKDERPKEYPDFMGKKKGKTSRRSEAVQGKMYRECLTIHRVCSHLHEGKETGGHTIKLDPAFSNYKKYAVSSRQARDEYNEKLQDLMSLYGIATEAEAVSGCFVRMHHHMEDRYERFEAERIAKDRIAHLRKQTRQEFFDEFGGEEKIDLDNCPENVMAKASAWYHASYSKGNPNLLSFPWVVADVLAGLKKRATRSSPIVEQPVFDRITRDLDEVYGTQFYTTVIKVIGSRDGGHSEFEDRRRYHALMYIRRHPTVINLISFLLQWGTEHVILGERPSQINQTNLLFLFVTFAVKQGFFDDLGMPTENETAKLRTIIWRPKERSTLGLGVTGELCISFLRYLSSYEFLETSEVAIHGSSLLLSSNTRENLHSKALVAYHLLAQTGDIRRLTSTTDTNKEILWEWGMIPPNVWNQYFNKKERTRERELSEETGARQVYARQLSGRARGPSWGYLSAAGTEESINKLELVMDNLIDKFRYYDRRPVSRRNRSRRRKSSKVEET